MAWPRSTRIVAVCDSYDALRNDRSYRKKHSHEEAIGVLVDGAGVQWDSNVVRALAARFPATTGHTLA